MAICFIADGRGGRAIARRRLGTRSAFYLLVVVGLYEHQLRAQFSPDESRHGAPDPLKPRVVVGRGYHALAADGHRLVRKLRPIPERKIRRPNTKKIIKSGADSFGAEGRPP